MRKSFLSILALVFLSTIYLTCTNEDSTFDISESNDPVYAICAVSDSMPDSSITYKEIIDNSIDSAKVTINDSLFFIGFITDSSLISNIKGYWLYGDSYSDTSFGVSIHDYDSAGEYIAEFIILDKLGNSDTATVKISITDEKPVLTIISVDTIINLLDTVILNAIYSDDGKIISATVNDTIINIADTLLWKSPIQEAGSSFISINIIDDDSHSVSDSLLVYVNSKPDSLKLLTPSDSAKSQSVNPVFTWVGYDRDYYDTTLTYSLYTIRNGSNLDTVQNKVKGLKEHTLASALAKGETVIWYVVAEDMYEKIIVSDTFSFTTISDEATSGALKGFVYREGFEGDTLNKGISVKAYGSGSEKGSAITDSLGSYLIENLTGAITLVFQDYGFKAESTIVSIVNGDTVTVSSDTLQDTLAPILQLTYDSIIKIGENANISWNVKDTFYSVDSVLVNFGDGFVKMSSTDTTISSDSSGDIKIELIAYDHNGNSTLDTANIHVNYPPSSVSLISPISNANVAVNTSVPFKWSSVDIDNKNDLKYDIYIGITPTLSDTDIEASSISDTSYLLSSSGEDWLTYYWKIVAYDGYDTVESVIDSFKVGEYTTGRLEGYALLQGMDNHTGIKLTAESQIDTLSYEIFVNDNGYYFADILPRTYTLTARDTMHNVFTNDAVSVAIIANDTVVADTMILLDTLAPHITCTYPTQSDTLISLSPRNITVTGTFSDTGSQVKPDSVVILLNSDTVKTATVTSSLWSFEINPIADGAYVIFISAKDGAGHEDTLTRSFYVNSKVITSSASINHDTIDITSDVTNVIPALHAFYLDIDGNGSWDDSVVSSDSSLSYLAAIDDYTLSGSEKLFIMAIDDSGMIIKDTVNYNVGSDTPIANAGNDTAVDLGSTLTVHGSYSQTYGHVVLWEWKFDNNSWDTCSGPDTTITLPSKYRSAYPCILRITDDNGATDLDTMNVTVGKEWEMVGGDYISLTQSNSFSLDIEYTGTPYIAYTDTVDTALENVFVKKYNGSTWEYVGTGSASKARAEQVDLALGMGYGYGGIQYGVYYLAFKERYVPSKIRIKKYSGGAWNEDVDTTVIRGTGYFDLEISSTSEFPSIAYRDYDNSHTGIVKYKDYSFNWVTRDTHLASSWYDDIALSRGGSAVYYENSGTHRISILKSGTWTTSIISGMGISSADMEDLTQYGNTSVYLSYRDAQQSDKMSVREFDGTNWTYVGTPGFSTGTVWNHQIVKDQGSSSNDVYLAYFDFIGGTGSLVVKHFDGSDWVTVGTEGFSSQIYVAGPKIAVKDGKIYVAYRDYNNGGRLAVITLK